MSLITGKKIVDFAFDTASSKRLINFSYFGGEPLLRFKLIKEITEYIRDKQQENARPISISITSNGTLLSQSIIDFLKEENIGLCISIDGPAHVHNLNRIYMDGSGSFEKVIEKLNLAIGQLEDVQVNAVYGPDTIEFLPDVVSFFMKFGISAIHLNPNICASWKENKITKLQENYMQIAHHYIKSYQSGREIAVNLIDSKVIIFLKGGYDCFDTCGMGETEWGFSPSGNIYPCERFIGNDYNSSFCLGNIHTGIVPSKLSSLLAKRGNQNEECKKCLLQKYCMNWCGCTNYYMTNHTNLTGPMICESEKAAIQAANEVLITLKDNELFLDHFMKYLQKEKQENKRTFGFGVKI